MNEVSIMLLYIYYTLSIFLGTEGTRAEGNRHCVVKTAGYVGGRPILFKYNMINIALNFIAAQQRGGTLPKT